MNKVFCKLSSVVPSVLRIVLFDIGQKELPVLFVLFIINALLTKFVKLAGIAGGNVLRGNICDRIGFVLFASLWMSSPNVLYNVPLLCLTMMALLLIKFSVCSWISNWLLTQPLLRLSPRRRLNLLLLHLRDLRHVGVFTVSKQCRTILNQIHFAILKIAWLWKVIVCLAGDADAMCRDRTLLLSKSFGKAAASPIWAVCTYGPWLALLLCGTRRKPNIRPLLNKSRKSMATLCSGVVRSIAPFVAPNVSGELPCLN